MINRILFFIFTSFLLTGCFAESLTLIQSGVGASQGRALQSVASPVLSLGVKKSTGKYPIQYVIERERDKIQKKAKNLENKVVKITKGKIEVSKEKIFPLKEDIKNQVSKLHDNILKAKTFAVKNFKHKPRFSYKVR
tara:strand:- start:76 stop:486 length:411 start_codon:yes stop_codon:yes gene_type:complete